VTDNPAKLNQMQDVVRELDKAPKQIHISVKLVTLTDADTERLGVNWSNGIQFGYTPLPAFSTAFPFLGNNTLFNNNFVGKLFAVNTPTGDVTNVRRFVGGPGGVPPIGGAQAVPTVGGAGVLNLGQAGFGGPAGSATTALFEMIKTKTSGQVIQSPTLVTLDNEEAAIQVGELFRFAESFVETTEGGGQVAGFREASNSPLQLGVTLNVLPHVTGPENNVLMAIVPQTQDFVPEQRGNPKVIIGPNGEQLVLPDTENRVVVTRMMLRSGETGVIGGLRTQSDVRTNNKVPVFGDIPFLGRLFRHKSRLIEGTNLLIFVTPTIVDLEIRDDFGQQLEDLRNNLSKPYAPFSNDTASAAP
jgi:type II secretory pathway component GspD/PulD (secretin)